MTCEVKDELEALSKKIADVLEGQSVGLAAMALFDMLMSTVNVTNDIGYATAVSNRMRTLADMIDEATALNLQRGMMATPEAMQ